MKNNKTNENYSTLEETNLNIINIEKPELRNYGNNKCYLFYKEDPLIVIGPNWLFYVILSSIAFITFIIIFIISPNKQNNLIGICIYLAHFLIYTFAVFKNPGIPSTKNQKEYYLNIESNKEKYRPCSICKSFIDIRSDLLTYHCSECGVCIEGFDHHCPWISKCVGKGNLILFYMFILSTIVYFFNLFYVIASTN